MQPEVGDFYDRYWSTLDGERARARSRERALVAVDMLLSHGHGCGRLLDVGCGPGWALEVFAARGYDSVGVDASPLAVEEARKKGLQALVLDMERADLQSIRGAAGGSFDVLCVLEVLEHLMDPLGALRRLRSLLRPAGAMVLSLPNEVHLPARLRVLAGRLPFGGHDDPHVRHFDHRSAQRLLDAAGCTVTALRHTCVAPPSQRLLRCLLRPWLPLLPGWLSLATIYLVKGGSDVQ